MHLPLEPKRDDRQINLEKYTITTAMTEERIIEIVQQALNSVNCACGVSNHMGSAATKDKRVMSIILAELKKRNLFFLDNLVTNESICREVAKQAEIKYVCRDFFLDNFDDYDYIKGQLNKLIQFALDNKRAVGIGHVKATTIRVLQEMLPEMQTKGIELVFVSDLTE